MDNIKINYNFEGMTDVLIEDVKDLVDKNINGKLGRYLNKLQRKKDSEILIDIVVKKTKHEKYDGSFRFTLDGKMVVYKNDVPFKNIHDLVNHAFDHLKLNFSKDKDKKK